jgi:hypothetical protein
MGLLLAAEIPESERNSKAAYIRSFVDTPVTHLYIHSQDCGDASRWPAELVASGGQRKVVRIVGVAATGQIAITYRVVDIRQPPKGGRFPDLFGEVPQFEAYGTYNCLQKTYRHKDRDISLLSDLRLQMPGPGGAPTVSDKQ